MIENKSDKVVKSLDIFSDVMTGVASAGKTEMVSSAGYLIRGLWHVDVVKRIKREWNYYREKGVIQEDYIETDQCKSMLFELLDALENEILDDERIELLKKIFFATTSEVIYDRNNVKAYQFMKLGRMLSTGEILVLFSCFRISLDEKNWKEDGMDARRSLIRIAKESGLAHPELVEVHEETLIVKKLLHKRQNADKSAVFIERKERYRLTSYGYAFCKFVEYYDLNLGIGED